MTGPTSAPFGSWASPISAREVAAGNVRLQQPQVDAGDLYWLERRPEEDGRTVLVRARSDSVEDITPRGYSVRSRVHEYGGGAYLVVGAEILFSNEEDNGLYLQREGEEPRPLRCEEGLRFADFDRHPTENWVVCVREDHREPQREARNTVVAVDLGSGRQRVLAQGSDFYASPRFSPDGLHLAWIAWSHPSMPWDETELWMADVVPTMRIARARKMVAHRGESVLQPGWDPTGALCFLSDRSGWWNLYRHHRHGVEAITALEAEIGGPLWSLGTSWYGFDGRGRAVCIVNAGAERWLGVVEATSEGPRRLDLPFPSFQDLAVEGDRALVVAGAPTRSETVIAIDLETGAYQELRASSAPSVSDAYVSLPEAISYPGSGGATAHAFYYPPRNPAFVGPEGERPPLIVVCHGGPTGQTTTVFDAGLQYWTTRGFGVLDVDYAGSTGYSRRYRDRLLGNMGVADVDDCVDGALFLAERGDVDRDRLAIRGRSAGGYVVLAALTFRDVFAAGASYYGIGDLANLVELTHKFESRYMDGLVGPYPEQREVYRARSPVLYPEWITTPVILFQGLRDTVVAPEQAESMVDALREQHIPFAYMTFADEGHGFRSADTIVRSLEAELYFYGRILGFTPAGTLPSVRIENLDVEAI